jgi:uncharacterized protein (DUF1697 family)
VKYVAFLRGINVGGNRPIKMDALRKALGSAGLRNVTTLGASGNVLFEALSSSSSALAKKIETQLTRSFGIEIGVIVRSLPQIQSMAKSDPFKRISATSQTQLYVTFLMEKTRGGTTQSALRSGSDGFRILRVTPNEVFSVVTLSKSKSTAQFLTLLEKGFGKKITTRNWNTIQKILRS